MRQIKEVGVTASWRDFHRVPHDIYQNDPHWIAPLESDIEKVFSAQSNKTYVPGMAKLWVLFDEQGKGIGRIAAFIDAQRNEKKGTKLGGIGFFECVNDPTAAAELFQ
ncbi:MAG: GNAT family N-acetyltransferase, partial [Bacteroidetes bacterium]